MPLYEYQCKKCKKRTEKIENLNGPFLTKCPSCGGPLERMMSAPAIQFKGSGWYVNDYGRGSSKQESGGKDSSNKDSSSKDSGGKDSGGGSDSGSKDSGQSDSSAKSDKSQSKSESKTESKSAGSSEKKKSTSKK